MNRPVALAIALIAGLPALSVAGITAESEPNATAAQASGPVDVGEFVTGTAAGSGDIDCYSYTPPSAGALTVGVHFDRGLAYAWRLYDTTGTLLLESDTATRPEVDTYAVPAGLAGTALTIQVRRTAWTGAAGDTTPYRLCLSFLDQSSRPAKTSGITTYLNGTAAPDTAVEPHAWGGPACLLMGGGVEVDAAFVNRAYPIIHGGNIVVLRATGTNGYQTYMYSDLVTQGGQQPASVETMVVNSVTKANDAYTAWGVRRAEMVWFAGGNQTDYTTYIRGTPVETAVVEAYNRGAVIGGTSAGMAIMGPYAYDPGAASSATSAGAIANPYGTGMTFTTDFFKFPIMDDIVTDTHFQFTQDNRMGRSLGFMARLRTDGTAPLRIVNVASSAPGSIFIDRDRIGRVDGTQPVWINTEGPETTITRCLSGQPLKMEKVLRTRMTADASTWFDFNDLTPQGTAYSRIRVTVNGDAPSTPYSPYTNTNTAPSVYGATTDLLPVAVSGFSAE